MLSKRWTGRSVDIPPEGRTLNENTEGEKVGLCRALAVQGSGWCAGVLAWLLARCSPLQECPTPTVPMGSTQAQHLFGHFLGCLGNANWTGCWIQFTSERQISFLKAQITTPPAVESPCGTPLTPPAPPQPNWKPGLTTLFHQAGGIQTHFHLHLQNKNKKTKNSSKQ